MDVVFISKTTLTLQVENVCAAGYFLISCRLLKSCWNAMDIAEVQVSVWARIFIVDSV